MTGEAASAPLDDAATVFVLRHGQTAYNAEQRIQGHLDLPLNDTGRWQAERLADALQHETIDAVYSSDLQRALQTAEPLARRRGLAVQRDAGLRERAFGGFEGLSFDEIDARWPDDAARWRRRDADFGPAGGETLRDFAQRCVATALALAARHRGGTIALVAHGGVLDCLYRAATGAPLHAPRAWQVANATVNRLLWTPQGFTLVGWNDAAHLEADAGHEPPPADVR